jgi:hypothetical protein
MNQSVIQFYQLQLPEKSRESHASKQNKQLGSNETILDGRDVQGNRPKL